MAPSTGRAGQNSAEGRPGGRARMEDVARIAGVSQMTVSRALRSPETVSAATRRRVAEAIAAVGYLHNRIAGGLAADRTSIVGLVATTLKNPLLASVVQGVCDAIAHTGYQLMLGMAESIEDEEQVIRDFLSYRPAAILLHRTMHTKVARTLLKASGIPVVEIGNLVARPIDLVVSFSNFDAAERMTRYLATKYGQVGYVGMRSEGDERFKARRRGYLAALREAGIAAEPERMLELPSAGPGGGGDALVTLLAARPDTRAVFFAGGAFASDALAECRRRGWAVPGRLAIAGFDDYESVFPSMAAITAVRVPRYEIGRRATEVALARLRGEAGIPRRTEFTFEIIPRETA
ncbi:MAG: LacI family DNA-binding transcriptional regulator [Alphaproteobacteria bacterium]|nr:LacI family DNA-binding transcriptional regulator [Alphaproteobacteria bacterium]